MKWSKLFIIIGLVVIALIIAYKRFFSQPKEGKTLTVGNNSGEPEILKQGARGSRVMALQRYLKQLGANFTDKDIDGIFGPQTEKELKRILNVTEISWNNFQTMKNLTDKAKLTQGDFRGAGATGSW